METAIVSLLCIALVVFGGMTMSREFLTSVDTSASGLQEIIRRDESSMRTELATVSASTPAANQVAVALENRGQTKLADFSKWDVIVQYYDGAGNYYTRWLPYTNGALGDNQWQVTWIHFNGQAEVFDPGVLNPGEQVEITAQLNPAAGAGTTNMVVIATPGGITTCAYFSPP
jgi:flagellar protein FlaF